MTLPREPNSPICAVCGHMRIQHRRADMVGITLCDAIKFVDTIGEHGDIRVGIRRCTCTRFMSRGTDSSDRVAPQGGSDGTDDQL